MRCKKCGNENRDDARFCRVCGSSLYSQSQRSVDISREPIQSRQHNQRHKTRVIASIALLSLIIIAASVVFIRYNAGSPNDLDTNEETLVRYSNDLYYDIPEEGHFAEDADTGIDYVDNEIIVYCNNGASIEEALRTSGVEGYEIVGHVAATGSYQIRLPRDMGYSDIEDLCRTIVTTEEVEKCSPNYGLVAEKTEKTRDPAWTEDAEKGKPSKTWGLESIRAPEAWDVAQASKDVRVGMLECSQFFTFHEDLDDAFVETLPSSDSQFDIKDGWGWFAEEDDHGTHVAGIIGAESNTSGSVGVAYGTKLYGYSCGGKDSEGNPKITDSYGIEVGLTYLTQDALSCRTTA